MDLHARSRGFAIAALLFAITACFYWRLVFTDQFTWLNSPDLAYQVLPWWQFQVGEIQQGRFPLWDPYVFGGQPLLGQAQPGTAYPLNWLLFILPTHHGWIRIASLNWYFVFVHFMAVGFAYLLCRDLGLSRNSSVLGGVVYGLGGYMGHIDWPQMINGAVWGPLIVRSLLRIARGEKLFSNAAFGGLFLGISFLSGHHQVPIFFGLMSAFFWAWILIRNRGLNRNLVAAGALFFLVAGLGSGFQSLPGWEYSKEAVRWAGAQAPLAHEDVVPYAVQDQYSLKPFMLLALIFPGIHAQANLLAGIAVVLLCVFALASWWERMEVRVAAFLATGGIFFALGSDDALHGVLYSLIPIINKARSPSMATVVADLGIALLAAFGLEAVLHSSEKDEARLRNVARLGFAFAAVVFTFFYGHYFFKGDSWTGSMRGLVTALVAVCLSACLTSWRKGNWTERSLSACVIALVFIELGGGSVSYHAQKSDGWPYLKQIRNTGAVIEKLQKLGFLARTHIHSDNIPYNIGDWAGIDTWNAYLASMTKNVYQADPQEGFFGVSYYVGDKPWGRFNEEIYHHQDGWTIYRNPNAFPRAWTVHEADAVANRKAALAWLKEKERDLRIQAVVEGTAPQLEKCTDHKTDRVQIDRRAGGEVKMTAQLACRGLVILSDTYYAGWQAWVDGKAVPIQEAYGSLRAVAVDAGRHQIEMRYRPWSVYVGFIMTILGILIAFAARRLDPVDAAPPIG